MCNKRRYRLFAEDEDGYFVPTETEIDIRDENIVISQTRSVILKLHVFTSGFGARVHRIPTYVFYDRTHGKFIALETLEQILRNIGADYIVNMNLLCDVCGKPTMELETRGTRFLENGALIEYGDMEIAVCPRCRDIKPGQDGYIDDHDGLPTTESVGADARPFEKRFRTFRTFGYQVTRFEQSTDNVTTMDGDIVDGNFTVTLTCMCCGNDSLDSREMTTTYVSSYVRLHITCNTCDNQESVHVPLFPITALGNS